MRSIVCGIAGVVASTWSDPEEVVGRMLEALRHRGPDDVGVEVSGRTVLGARRLSVIDLASGHQPMTNESGSVVAVQNGEIYNFREVRAELRRRGHTFKSESDTEILPHAYEEFGDCFVERLRGMFAIALWDADARRLVLARDRIGKKPLCYARVGDGLIFASEVQALLATPVGREVDDEAIAEYLRLGYVRAPRTGFREIRRLAPGEALVHQDGRLAIRRYWRLPAGPKLRIGETEALEGLRASIDEAVRLRLISDVPLGAFLSGGLDSSTIVEAMARLSPGRVRTFSVGFTERDFSELRYARMVADRFGTEHHEFIVEPSAAEVLPMLVRHVGEPFADSSIIPTYYVARTARQHVTVALNGDGGDELFAGYERYRAASLAALLDRVPRPVRTATGLLSSLLPAGAATPRSVRRLRRFAMELGRAPDERYFRWHGYFTSSEILGERITDLAGSLAWPTTAAAHADPVDRLMALDLETYLPGDLLVKMDIASMAASLEARSPFLDHHLVEYVSRLPTHFKLRGARTKVILRKLMADALPAPILERGKMGFSLPVGAWLRGPLRPMLEDLVLAGPDRGYVDRSAASELVSAHLHGRHERSHLVWSLLMLELWFRYVAEAPRPQSANAAA